MLLLKNIDNAILTSFRTLSKQNNVITNTLKVVHNKFTPKQLSRQVRNTFKKATHALYSVSEIESAGDEEDEAEIRADEATPIEEMKITKPAAANQDIKTKAGGSN